MFAHSSPHPLVELSGSVEGIPHSYEGEEQSMHVDAVVVGAGIIGASCAFFLAQEGLKVALVERGGIASGTSGSGEGNILVSDKEPGAELALAQQGCLLWKRLASILPDDFEFEEKGGVVVAETDEHL